MAKHQHIVVNPDTCDIVGICLPEESTGSTTSARIRQALVGLINGFNTDFTSQSLVDRSDLEKSEWVYYNGQLLTEGTTDDYVASEGGGVGTGYDTFTMNFVPKDGDRLEIIYIPVV